jgi:hypothetical protein
LQKNQKIIRCGQAAEAKINMRRDAFH